MNVREKLSRMAAGTGLAARAYEALKRMEIRRRCRAISKGNASVTGNGALCVCFVIPGCTISGGLRVAFDYANELLRRGLQVMMLCTGEISSTDWFADQRVEVRPLKQAPASFDVLISTAWNTDLYLDCLPAKRKIYMVQADERRFYAPGTAQHRMAERTYRNSTREIMVIARWMQRWLKEEFGLESIVIENGIRFEEEYAHAQPLEARREALRVLIEGDPSSAIKNVKAAFDIARQIEGAEIWHVSPTGETVPGEHRTFSRVPHGDMPSIYAACDVLVKTSRSESYCLPALEMMATGGVVVAFETDGVKEFIRNGENGFIVAQDDIEAAVDTIFALQRDPERLARIRARARQDAEGYELKDRLERFARWIVRPDNER